MKTCEEKRVRLRSLALVTAVAAGAPGVAAAQTSGVQSRTTHIIEWNLPATADASPGAMVVDTRGEDDNRVWFVTRLGNQRVYRLNPVRSLMKGEAQWTSWDLNEDSFTTGGSKKLRASHDRRFVYVRTVPSIQRIDTQSCDSTTMAGTETCERVEWLDQVDPVSGQPASPSVSDLAVNDYNDILTAGTMGGTIDLTTEPDATKSFIQMIPAGTTVSNGGTTTVTARRWTVGGGAGFCSDLGRTTTSLPCLSGVDTWPGNRDLVYFSLPEGCADGLGAIGELNTSTNVFRQWCFTNLPVDSNGPVQQPRQLKVHPWGMIWVVTGSGHLVSLDVKKNLMTKYAIPAGITADPFGVAPDDDVVGYTDAEVSNPRVGMLLPSGFHVTVQPITSTVLPQNVTVTALGERAAVDTGSVPPEAFVVPATVTPTPDGTFVEAMVGANGGHDSESPLGITPAKWKGQGTFFYAVGLAGNGADRVGFVRLPMVQKPKHPRDDDDTDDGYPHDTHPQGYHTHQAIDGTDADDDGLDASVDLPNAQENVTAPDASVINPGQFEDYAMTATPTSLALIGSVVTLDLTSLVEVDIYNSLGTLVASQSGPGTAIATLALPSAGNYTLRVRNLGLSPLTETPLLIVREPPIQ